MDVNGKVDVLTVMDRLAGHARTLSMTGDPAIRESIRQAAEAHDAVTELIAAANGVPRDGSVDEAAWDRLDAALARVSP